MKILVIHQVPDAKIDYRNSLDHQSHEVTYIGFPRRMADLPEDLRCVRVELEDGQDLVEGITSRVSRADGFEKVLSLSEFGQLEAWHVRNHLGLHGTSLPRLERIRDKVSMKGALAESGLRYPRFVAAPMSCRPLPWRGKTVLKPRRGASSEDVHVYETAMDALGAYWKLDKRHDYQLEEYVEGEILHADGLVSGGALVDLVVSRYVNKPIDFVGGRPLGSHQIPFDPRHRAFAEQVVKVLEIEEGSLHLEMFETPQRDLIFLEVANRVGGAGVITAHLRHRGVHLPAHEIAIRLGLDRPEPAAASGRYHGWLVFPGHHLERERGHTITIPDHLRAHSCVDKVYQLAPTDPLPDHVTYHEWLTPVFIEASHRDAGVLRDFLTECARSISVDAGGAE